MTRRRELAELAAGVIALAAILACGRLLVSAVVIRGFFAIPSPANPAGGAVWSNLVASAVCLAAVWWRIRVRMIAHHAEALALSARLHRERMAQAAEHHQVQLTQAREHHEALRAHVTRVLGDHSAVVSDLADATRLVLAHRGASGEAAA